MDCHLKSGTEAILLFLAQNNCKTFVLLQKQEQISHNGWWDLWMFLKNFINVTAFDKFVFLIKNIFVILNKTVSKVSNQFFLLLKSI